MTFDELKKLRHRENRDQLGLYLAEGEHLVLELIRALPHTPALAASKIIVTYEYESEKLPKPWPKELLLQRVSARQMAALSDTRSPQGIIAVVPVVETTPPRVGERVLYLHEVQDPGNLGALLRTLAWFGNFRCLLSPQSADLYNPKVVRASMGALFHVPVEREVPLKTLQSRYPRLALLDLEGTSITGATFRQFDAYVFGNEAQGLPKEIIEQLRGSAFSIPGAQKIESLNLAAAVNICAYELSRPGASN
jgi:TrmH family RNA methyltransferase